MTYAYTPAHAHFVKPVYKCAEQCCLTMMASACTYTYTHIHTYIHVQEELAAALDGADAFFASLVFDFNQVYE